MINNKNKLKKIAAFAVERGWKGGTESLLNETIAKNVLFDHDFCQSFFSLKKRKISHYVLITIVREHDGCHQKHNVEYEEVFTPKQAYASSDFYKMKPVFKKQRDWVWHIKEMALSQDPINYCYQYIKNAGAV